MIVAPETEQSASSHSLSLHRPLRLRAGRAAASSRLDGTPADCVYVALHADDARPAAPARPGRLAASTTGMNLGQDVFYSGTVAAAREGALRGIPAVAASAHHAAPISRAVADRSARSRARAPRRAARRRARAAAQHQRPEGWTGEVRATRLGARIYEEIVDFRNDPRGREYLWLGGPGVRHERDAGTDTDAYDDGAARSRRSSRL